MHVSPVPVPDLRDAPMPDLARKYLRRAIGSAPLDLDAVRVRMEGRLKLNGTWYDFGSTLDVDALSGFRWEAAVQRGLVEFEGHDEYHDNHGEMLWKLYGLLPVVKASGADVTHSARGRAALEQIFLPMALALPEVRWTETSDAWQRATWRLDGEDVSIELNVDPDGRLRAVRARRWSEADGKPWHFVTFGCEVIEEGFHAGLTVPGKFVAGWFYGEPRWDEGQMFEGAVSDIEPR